MGTTTTVPTESSLRDQMAKAETAEEIAEICRLEAEIKGGPFFEQVKHTPGPWEVGYAAHNVWATDHKGNFPVCDIRGWGHFTGNGHGALGLPAEQGAKIQVANAYLIAAAPDMLAALHELEEFLDNRADADDGRPNDAMRHLMEVRAAIAKAEGRTP